MTLEELVEGIGDNNFIENLIRYSGGKRLLSR
jgi:hypothetical protein